MATQYTNIITCYPRQSGAGPLFSVEVAHGWLNQWLLAGPQEVVEFETDGRPIMMAFMTRGGPLGEDTRAFMLSTLAGLAHSIVWTGMHPDEGAALLEMRS